MPVPRSRVFTAVLALAALACGCGQTLDPTQIFSPPPPLAHGVNLTAYFAGDASSSPVINVWVNDSGDTYNVKTLLTTSASQSLSCPAANPCPCEGGASVPGGTYGYWPLFCHSMYNANTLYNGGNQSIFITDANSHASSSYPFSIPLYFGWDWSGHNGLPVANGAYVLHVEVSGYAYGTPGEAQVTVQKNGAAGSAQGTVDGTRWLQISADWKP